MIDVPQSLKDDLKLLPLQCGLLWGHQTGIPVFAIVTHTLFDQMRIRYRPFRQYVYKSEGVLLEFPLEVSGAANHKIPISLLIDPSDPDQWQQLHHLSKAPCVEIIALNPTHFQSRGEQIIEWPDTYRTGLLNFIKNPMPMTQWPLALTRWKKERNYFQQSGNTEVNHKHLYTMSFRSSHIDQELKPYAPLAYVTWDINKNQEPEFVVKVPRKTDIQKWTIACSSPTFSETYAPEGRVVVVSFKFMQRGSKAIKGHCLLNPVGLKDQEFLILLCRKQFAYITFLNDDNTLTYLETRSIPWDREKCKGTNHIIANANKKQIMWPQVKERWLQEHKSIKIKDLVNKTDENSIKKGEIVGSQREHQLLQRYRLSPNWRKALPSHKKCELLLLSNRKRTPCVLIKILQVERMETIKIVFDENISQNQNQPQPILHILLRLQNHDSQARDMRFSMKLKNDPNIFMRLQNPDSIPVFMVADNPELSLLDVQNAPWPKQDIAQFVHQYHPVQSTSLAKPVRPKQEKNTPTQAAVVHVQRRYVNEPVARPVVENMSGLELVERCLLQQRAWLDTVHAPGGTITRQMFWRQLLIFALEEVRKFVFMPDAIEMIEEKRQQLQWMSPHVTAPGFPAPQLWFEFRQPVRTPICEDTAAIFIFSMNEKRLLDLVNSKSRHISTISQSMKKRFYESEYNRLAISVINQRGQIVWAMSQAFKPRSLHPDYPWLVPAWHTCPTKTCTFSEEHALNNDMFCATCKQAYAYFSSWLYTVRKAFLGSYREPFMKNGAPDQPDAHFMKPEKWRKIGDVPWNTIHSKGDYHIIHYTDISASFRYQRKEEPLNARGSWVEALQAIDPRLVEYDKREVHMHTRRLMHPRYAKYREEHGTDMIDIKTHTRQVPLNADKQRVTRVTARKHKK